MTGPLLSEFERAHLMTGMPNINAAPDPLAGDERAKDNDAKRVLYLEAKDLLDEKGVFILAVRAVRARWYGELMDAADRDKKADLLAKLKCLDEIPREIKRFVSDYSMAMDKVKNARRN